MSDGMDRDLTPNCNSPPDIITIHKQVFTADTGRVLPIIVFSYINLLLCFETSLYLLFRANNIVDFWISDFEILRFVHLNIWGYK